MGEFDLFLILVFVFILKVVINVGLEEGVIKKCLVVEENVIDY